MNSDFEELKKLDHTNLWHPFTQMQEWLGEYPQRDEPEEMAEVVRLALSGQVPTKDEEGTFLRSVAGARSPAAAVFVGHSDIQDVVFPGAVEYSPAGYVIGR